MAQVALVKRGHWAGGRQWGSLGAREVGTRGADLGLPVFIVKISPGGGSRVQLFHEREI